MLHENCCVIAQKCQISFAEGEVPPFPPYRHVFSVPVSTLPHSRVVFGFEPQSGYRLRWLESFRDFTQSAEANIE
jgi:hypothetical protein